MIRSIHGWYVGLNVGHMRDDPGFQVNYVSDHSVDLMIVVELATGVFVVGLNMILNYIKDVRLIIVDYISSGMIMSFCM